MIKSVKGRVRLINFQKLKVSEGGSREVGMKRNLTLGKTLASLRIKKYFLDSHLLSQ